MNVLFKPPNNNMDQLTILICLSIFASGVGLAILYFVFNIGTALVALHNHQMAMGDSVKEQAKRAALSATYFDLEARGMQNFIEMFLGKGFNAQCNFFHPAGKDPVFNLWIWKRYENRDMGVHIQGSTLMELMAEFMRVYYTLPYFTDAIAFPDGRGN